MATKPFYIHQKPPAQSFIRLPNFLFEAPSFCFLSSEAKLLYAMILRRTDLSRKTDGPTIMAKFICITPSTRCASCCTVAVKKRWTRCGNCNMQILYPSKSRVVENQTVSTQNTMKRFRTPTSRNPVAERQNIEKRAL